MVSPTVDPAGVGRTHDPSAVATGSASSEPGATGEASPPASAGPAAGTAAPASSGAAPAASSGAAPSGAPTVPAASTATTAPADPSATAGKPARATVGEPKFEGGDVPKAKAALDKLGKKIAKCVTEHGGLRDAKGSIEVQFLVRAQGIAEGVDVIGATGIDPDAKKCVRDALKKKTIGPPSSDPVGVTVKIELEIATP